MKAGHVLRALINQQPIAGRVAIIAAHYDDETLGVGGSLAAFPSGVSVVHVTDSGHQDPQAWARAGVATRDQYAALRRREFDAAMRAGSWPLTASVVLDSQDQQVAYQIPDVVDALISVFAAHKFDVVLTHAYEGGHPDHDAVACAVQMACTAIRTSGGVAPIRLEFTGYHLRDGVRHVGRFFPDARRPSAIVALGEQALAQKQRALACFTSQASVIRWFRVGVEAFRVAPDYDFSQPPPPGLCLYDRFGWALTGDIWRTYARAALAVAP